MDLIDEKQLTVLLRKSFEESRPLRVKFGMDPSSPDLHLGHAVPLMKLRDIQDLGHQVVLIVGDATAMVGDPSGRNKLRPQLTRAEVELNLATYKDQAACVLDIEATEIRQNSEWFDEMNFYDVLELAGRMTVARMIERDTFQKRMQAQEPIGIHEFLYPLMQGWDSVEIANDVELGGNDQLFNLLVGRQLQEQRDMCPQVCFTMPLINGLDGRKMSKSYGNSIGLTEAPGEMFGKIMALDDPSMEAWFTLLTRVADAEVETLLAGHPREAKARLAREIVTFFHSSDAADVASKAFDRQFRDRQLPENIQTEAWPVDGDELPLAILLKELGLAKSSSEARRLVQQGGVRLDGDICQDPMQAVLRPASEFLLQVGKRRFQRVTPR